jgi:GNAT superfamily N-acetyltransferase
MSEAAAYLKAAAQRSQRIEISLPLIDSLPLAEHVGPSMSNALEQQITFRRATVADSLAVAQVHVQSWRESFRGIVPQSFLDAMSLEKRRQAFRTGFAADFYRMFLAETAKTGVIGFADFGKARETERAYETELYAIYLLRDFQRQGIGGKLFALGVESLVADGMNSMYLLTLELSPYKSFYEKMGGRVVDRKAIEIEGVKYTELIYGWNSLS